MAGAAHRLCEGCRACGGTAALWLHRLPAQEEAGGRLDPLCSIHTVVLHGGCLHFSHGFVRLGYAIANCALACSDVRKDQYAFQESINPPWKGGAPR